MLLNWSGCLYNMGCIGLSNPASLNRLFFQNRIDTPSAAIVWCLLCHLNDEMLLLNCEASAYVQLILKLIMGICSFQLIAGGSRHTLKEKKRIAIILSLTLREIPHHPSNMSDPCILAASKPPQPFWLRHPIWHTALYTSHWNLDDNSDGFPQDSATENF